MGTRVFISWSGDTSRRVGEAMRDWLPKVIQAVEPFMSSADIAAGSRPLADIESSLESADFGVICVSGDNWDRPWLNFEAGAISKRLGLEETRVSPLLIDLAPEDIDSPLKQFQMKRLDVDGVWDVVRSLNDLGGEVSLSEYALGEAFDLWWPRLEEALASARLATDPTPVVRGVEDKLDEVLTLVRSLAARASDERQSGHRLAGLLMNLGQPWSFHRTLSGIVITTPSPIDKDRATDISSAAGTDDVTFVVAPVHVSDGATGSSTAS